MQRSKLSDKGKNRKVMENIVTISLEAWPIFDQFSCIFENISWCDEP